MCIMEFLTSCVMFIGIATAVAGLILTVRIIDKKMKTISERFFSEK